MMLSGTFQFGLNTTVVISSLKSGVSCIGSPTMTRIGERGPVAFHDLHLVRGDVDEDVAIAELARHPAPALQVHADLIEMTGRALPLVLQAPSAALCTACVSAQAPEACLPPGSMTSPWPIAPRGPSCWSRVPTSNIWPSDSLTIRAGPLRIEGTRTSGGYLFPGSSQAHTVPCSRRRPRPSSGNCSRRTAPDRARGPRHVSAQSIKPSRRGEAVSPSIHAGALFRD